jgi:hypothetical protein
MKIVLYATDPAARPLRGTVGREGFFKYLVTNPPRRRPFGGGTPKG